MFKKFYPSLDCKSAYDIDYEKMYEAGYRGIMFDIDNTLVEHDEPATQRAIDLFERLHAIGYKTCIISNNKELRVKPFAEALKSQYLYKSGKPSPDGYKKCMELMNTDRANTFFVGDQLFTDIWGGNRSGVYSVLVSQIAKHEEIQIILKRRLEKPVLMCYRHYKKKKIK